jgi:hypothetical protein
MGRGAEAMPERVGVLKKEDQGGERWYNGKKKRGA